MPETETIISQETTTQEGVVTDFVKELKITPEATPEKANPFVIPEKKEDVPPIKKEDVTQGETTTQNSTKTEDTPVKQDDNEFVVTPEDLGSFLNDETEGAIKTVSELHTIININRQLQERIKELETNPLSAFKDEKQASIAKFLMDYKGGDYHTGIQTYAKLQSLDIPNMKAEDALREAYIMDRAQQGISRTDAEEMFTIEFDKKYGDYGDKAEKFMSADAWEARKKLQDAKESFTVEPKKEDNQSAQQEEMFKEQRMIYEQSVDKAFKSEKGEEFKTIILSELTDDPKNDFVFEIENPAEIKDVLLDYQASFAQRYGLEGGGFNAELMKMDQAIIHNFGKISQELFKHGETIGYEKAIMERQNIPKKTDAAPTQHAGKGDIPLTFKESLMQAKAVL